MMLSALVVADLFALFLTRGAATPIARAGGIACEFDACLQEQEAFSTFQVSKRGKPHDSLSQAPAPASPPVCGRQFVNKCTTPWLRGGVLLELNLADSDKCRTICSFIGGCRWYAFGNAQKTAEASTNCKLFSTPYKEFLDHCDQVGGDSVEGVAEQACTDPKANSCEMFRWGGCDIRGSTEETFQVPSDSTGLAMCIKLVQASGGAGYMWHKEEGICTSFSEKAAAGWQNTCSWIYGPPGPTESECKFAEKPVVAGSPLPAPSQPSKTDGPCGAFSFGRCQVGAWPYQANPDSPQEVCSKLCNVDDRCNFFAFDSNSVKSASCKLYEAPEASLSDTLAGCYTVAGPPSEDGAGSCMTPAEGTPEMHIDAECDYPGTVLESFAVPDLSMCSKLCNPIPELKLWVFHKHGVKNCFCLDSAERRCSLHFGPRNKAS